MIDPELYPLAAALEIPVEQLAAELKAAQFRRQDKLRELTSRCKCGVYVSVNAHRDIYETAKQYLDGLEMVSGEPLEVSADVLATMIETNTIVEVHFYPDNPISFFKVYHHDLDAALDEALACFEETQAV